MTTKALRALATLAETSGVGHVQIETFWGWHYVMAADEDGRRTRVLGRVGLSGHPTQHVQQFALAGHESQRFVPTLAELGVA